MDLEHRGAKARATHPRLAADEDLLELPPDGQPKTVFVTDLGGGVAGFRMDERQPYQTGGLKWQPASQHDLFITFVFVEGIEALEPSSDLPTVFLSSTFEDRTQQQGCVPGPQKTEMEYHFWVKFLSGLRHDPKIVVTPL